MSSRWWIGTIPRSSWNPHLPNGILFLRGQPELGEGGYAHWQICFYTEKKCRIPGAKRLLGVADAHVEATRSKSAVEYVWKEQSRDGERFEFGEQPVCRSKKADWDQVWLHAVSGEVDKIPSDIRIRCYNAIRRIYADSCVPVAMERSVSVFWGKTGTGKSRRAWEEAGVDAYAKDPNSKWWDGYRDQEHVIIDEFRGRIDIAHVLRWFDRYPVCVETKGASRPLLAKKIWVTSNLHPECWYPELDPETRSALMRRINVEFFE